MVSVFYSLKCLFCFFSLPTHIRHIRWGSGWFRMVQGGYVGVEYCSHTKLFVSLTVWKVQNKLGLVDQFIQRGQSFIVSVSLWGNCTNQTLIKPKSCQYSIITLKKSCRCSNTHAAKQTLSLFSTHFSFVGFSSHNNSAQAKKRKKKSDGNFFNWNNSKLKVLFSFHFAKNNKSQCVSQPKTSTFLQLPQKLYCGQFQRR